MWVHRMKITSGAPARLSYKAAINLLQHPLNWQVSVIWITNEILSRCRGGCWLVSLVVTRCLVGSPNVTQRGTVVQACKELD